MWKFILPISVCMVLIGSFSFLSFQVYEKPNAEWKKHLTKVNYLGNQKSVPSTKNDAVNVVEKREQTTRTASVTLKEMKHTYRYKFEQLRKRTNNKLDALLEQAFTEYRNKRKQGEQISYLSFLKKYKALADQLEEETDRKFYQLYNQLQGELISHGYSKTEATVFLETYKSVKKERKEKIWHEIWQSF